MAIRTIALLGNPVLRVRCVLVRRRELHSSVAVIRDLEDTLSNFRKRKGFGRGIAAPQIGITQRIIYINGIGELVNPRIIQKSKKTMELWDDCFSFPELLVRVRRNFFITVEYLNRNGERKRLKAQNTLSELIQHEIDHLNGILAIDRALDSHSIILRSELEKANQS